MHELHKSSNKMNRVIKFIKENWMLILSVAIMYFIILFTFGIKR